MCPLRGDHLPQEVSGIVAMIVSLALAEEMDTRSIGCSSPRLAVFLRVAENGTWRLTLARAVAKHAVMMAAGSVI